MALIKCSECGKDVSDKAEICINCGNPIQKSIKQEKLKNGKSFESLIKEGKKQLLNIMNSEGKYQNGFTIIMILLGVLAFIGCVGFALCCKKDVIGTYDYIRDEERTGMKFVLNEDNTCYIKPKNGKDVSLGCTYSIDNGEVCIKGFFGEGKCLKIKGNKLIIPDSNDFLKKVR